MTSTADSAFPFRWWEFVWYLLIFCIGAIGNLLVIYVIIFNKKINTTSSFNILVMLLAVADLLVSMVGLPIYYLSTDAFNHPDASHGGDYLCMFFTGYFIPFFLLDVSVFALMLIAIGRRKAITKPLSVLDDDDVTIKKILPILFAIAIPLALGMPTVFGLRYTPEKPMVGNHCSYRYTFIESIVIYCVAFSIDTIIPIVVLITCFAHISQSFKRTSKLLTKSVQQQSQQQQQPNNKIPNDAIFKQKLKSISTMRLVVIAFFLCILPNHVLYLASLAGVGGLGWNTEICQVGVLIRFTNSCVNPLLYSFMSQKFRKNFKSTFPFCFDKRRQHKKLLLFRPSVRDGLVRRDGYVAIQNNESVVGGGASGSGNTASSNVF